MSPALPSRFLTTGPPEKSLKASLYKGLQALCPIWSPRALCPHGFPCGWGQAGSHLPVLLSEKPSPIYTQICFSLLLRCHPISEDSPAGLLIAVYPLHLLAFFPQPDHPNLPPPRKTQAPGGQLLLFSCSVMSSFATHELQHASIPCPLLSTGVCSNSGSLSQWYHVTISSVVPFSSCPQSFPASGSFPVS